MNNIYFQLASEEKHQLHLITSTFFTPMFAKMMHQTTKGCIDYCFISMLSTQQVSISLVFSTLCEVY
jgi:hypothetical protein